jgi:DNA processing protein
LNELEALVILAGTPHLGSVKIRLLMKHFGSALNALEAQINEIAILPGFGTKILQEWGTWKKDSSWEVNFEIAYKNQATIIPFYSDHYPKKLLELPDFPILLYVKGKILSIDQRSIAIVGTREASVYGREMADRFSQDLANYGFTVVSGLARGIDTAAHYGALRRGRTLAVIGSGLANIYPPENLDLAQVISTKGALISEFPMNTAPDRQNFPQRNRIVAGLTLGTLLIEAPVKSGAMITMDKALTYKKRLFAIPGRLDNENFSGNHVLIKNGQAQLVENAKDIMEQFDQLFGGNLPPVNSFKHPILEKEEEVLLSLLPNEELNIDEIVQLTKYPVTKLNVLLMSLLLKKTIKLYPGKIYKKVYIPK